MGVRTALDNRSIHDPPRVRDRINECLLAAPRKLTKTITEATFSALGALDTSESVALGTVEAGAQIIGVNFRALTPFTGGGNGAVTVDVGSAGDTDALVDGADVFAAAVDGQASSVPTGIAPKKFFATATALAALFVCDVGLKELTAGSVIIEVLYSIQV